MTQGYERGGKLLLLNIALGLGTFVQILDTSIANVAIPYIAGNLNISPDQGTWVITSFAVSNAIVLPLTGWLSNHFGRVRLFVWSILLFALTSFFCGLATNLAMLVGCRILQGAVAGSLIPLSQSLIVNSNPPENQGTALGFWGMIVIVAPILGPIIGGYLTDEYSWPWIFYINVPVGMFSAFITWIFLKDKESEIIRNPIDWTGLVLLSVGVGFLQIMLDKGKDLDWFESNVIITLLITSMIFLSYFFIWNHYQKYPIVDFSYFKNRNFLIGTMCATLGYFVFFGGTVTLPLWLQTQQGYTGYWAGVAIAPIGIVPFLLSPIVGKYMTFFDLRYVISLSFFFFAVSFFAQSHFTAQVDISTIMLTRFLQGFGVTIFFLPLVQLSLSNVSRNEYASASGLFNFMRILVGSGFGTSLFIQLWTRFEIFHHARLGESLTSFNPKIKAFYHSLKNSDSSITDEISKNILNGLVDQQAFVLSINELAWLSGWLCLALIPLLFLSKPVKSLIQGPKEAAH
ncbi:MAG: DHA2 family efflux MFS transporter permease subunit [Parachlamydiaceae bacterium]